jgi:large subunit ribosomal protein L24
MGTTLKLKKGDTVQMLSGKDRGKQGRIIDARPREGKVVVENLNQVAKHQKPRPIRDANRMGGTQIAPGGIIHRPSAVSASNVMLVCPTCKLPTRVGFRFKETKGGDRVKVRVCRHEACGQEIDR